MPRKAKPAGSKQRVEEQKDAAPDSSALDERVIERPNGFYWESKAGKSYGPFASLAEAEADMLSGGAAAAEEAEGEGLHEAESELGINEWIDPDTGGPAEDNVPRIEDH